MRFLRGVSLVPLLATVSNSAPAAIKGDEPCARVGQLFDKAARTNSTKSMLFPGELVHRCLLSMPFHADRAVKFIDMYEQYLQFQSTLELLKDPPASSQWPGVDLIEGLSVIRSKAAHREYHSQFEFDSDIVRLIQSAHDGHLSVQLCSTTIFQFVKTVPLVSVSADGIALPQVYTWNDAVLKEKGVEVSPVVSIDSVDAAEYLERSIRENSNMRDPDAQYNSLFPSEGRKISTFTDATDWSATTLWPGAHHTIEFRNKTKIVVDTSARLVSTNGDLAQFPWQNGSALLADFCQPGEWQDLPLAPFEWNGDPLPLPSAYPHPVVRDPYNTIAGYHSTKEALQDIAVLSVPTFMSVGAPLGQTRPQNETAVFQRVAADYLTDAVRTRKKKLIIDVSGNFGGVVFAALSLFKTIFPQEPVISATRFRAHRGVDLLGRGLALYTGDYQGGPFTVKNPVTPDQEHNFTSWEDLYGPYNILGMNMSRPLANFDLSEASDPIYPIPGYGSIPLNPEKNPFAPEDIIVITDGLCSSACSLFMKLLKAQGVRTIVFGGRPRLGPMQAVGGVRGELTYATQQITWEAQLAYKEVGLLTPDERVEMNKTIPMELDKLPFYMTGSVNIVNGYAVDDEEAVMPLEFVYEAADCRRFFTMEEVLSPESVWEAAAKAMFGGGECLEG